MEIKEKVLKEVVVGFSCDMCYEENRHSIYNRSTLSKTFENDENGLFQQWVDLCDSCTRKVFDFISSEGGRMNYE